MSAIRAPYKTACMNIAVYLRISQDDGADIESVSIKNQREIIRSYIAGHDEFSGAALTDYIDDGLSGSHSDREAYKRLMCDIDRGEVDCVIVKDLSRIGRNLIDVDDLLMNYLVTLNVRFIAINNGYDSFSSPLSNLELAIINLANQHYNKDLAVKSMTAKNVKSKRGEYLAHAPFGYKKSETQKNKLVPEGVRCKGGLSQTLLTHWQSGVCGTNGRHRTRRDSRERRSMEISYTLVGDYYLPNIALTPVPAEERVIPLGKYARMRRTFLKEHRPIEYSRLLLSEQLFPHLREVDATADERRQNGVPEGIIVKEIVCE